MTSTSPPLQQLNRTFIGSVLFLDIVDYSKQTVQDQVAMKEVFIDLLIEALKHVGSGERIMVDTGDGAAVAFLADPEDALFTALSLRDAVETGKGPVQAAPGFVRMGINLGPLKIVRDVNGHTNMIGDGVNDAQRVMSFSQPGQVMVSHSYYDIISRFSRDYSALFVYEGTKHDKHVREHELYRLGAVEDAWNISEKMRDRSRAKQDDAVAAAQPVRSPGGKHTARYVAIAAVLVAAGLLATLAGHKAMRPDPEPVPATLIVKDATAAMKPVVAPIEESGGTAPAASQPSANSTVMQKPAAAISVQADQLPQESPPVGYTSAKMESDAGAADKSKSVPAATAPAAPLKNGTLQLAIEPWGEVYVDGSKRGISPPLKSLNLAPGKHQIMVRNSTFEPYKLTVDVQSGANTTVHYAF